MNKEKFDRKIIIVDDEWQSPILRSVKRRLDEEGWQTKVVVPEGLMISGDDFEVEAMFAIESESPDAVLLDVRFGEHREDRFKGLSILRNIVEQYPHIPVLMFTQYVQGPDREAAVTGTLKWDSRVDFIDKLASPEEVVLRLRRLIGTAPETIPIGGYLTVDVNAKVIYVVNENRSLPVDDIMGTKFEIFFELASTMYRNPGEVVPFSKLMKYSEGEDPRASLRVRIREIKDAIGNVMGVHIGANDLIVNVRGQGYRMVSLDL